jgi:hypothetical protein
MEEEITESRVMCYSVDDPKENAHYLVMIPMLHGDNPNVAFRLHSTDQTEVKTEENILPRGIFFLKYRRMNND